MELLSVSLTFFLKNTLIVLENVMIVPVLHITVIVLGTPLLIKVLIKLY